MLGEVDEMCRDTCATRDKGEEKEEEERGAAEVGGASAADVRQTRREAVEVALPSRAQGGQVIGCVGKLWMPCLFDLVFQIQNLKLNVIISIKGYSCNAWRCYPLSEVCMGKN